MKIKVYKEGVVTRLSIPLLLIMDTLAVIFIVTLVSLASSESNVDFKSGSIGNTRPNYYQPQQHSVSGNTFPGGFGTNIAGNNGAVAFSVMKANLYSLSAPTFINFEETLTNVGFGWNQQTSTFQVSISNHS